MFAVVSVRKGHLKVTKESGISLVNKHIMEKKETNKVTKTAKMEAKTTSRGEKCLAKFTAANGNVYGSLTLDIRKAGDYSQPLPVAVRVCHAGQKVFLRLGKTYTMEEWLTLCEYEKSGRRVQLTERNDMKNLWTGWNLSPINLSQKTTSLFASCKTDFRVKKMMTAPLLQCGIHTFNLRPMRARLVQPVVAKMFVTSL